MVRSPHMASRFFAAFYRWNRFPQQLTPCSRSAPHKHIPIQHLPTRCSPRCYHQPRLLRQNEQVQLQSKDEEGGITIEILDDVLESEENRSARKDMSTEQLGTRVEEGLDKTLENRDLKNDVRRLMRQVPSSISVITAFRVEPGETEPQPLGVVVSSLCSVSLEPPTISFNLKHPSKTLDSIRAANGLFRVHFLSSNERSSRIADHFTRGNHPEAYALRRGELEIHSPRDLSDPKASPSLASQLKEKSVVAALECKVTQEVSVADHIIVVAEVNDLNSEDNLGPILQYRDGKYVRDDGIPLRSHDPSGKNT